MNQPPSIPSDPPIPASPGGDSAKDQLQAVADLLVNVLRPSSALEIGCGLGSLVLALRSCGVSALGVDFSEENIQHVHPEAAAFCRWIGPELPALPACDLVIWFGGLTQVLTTDVSRWLETVLANAKLFLITPQLPLEAVDAAFDQAWEHWIQFTTRANYGLDLEFSLEQSPRRFVLFCLSSSVLPAPVIRCFRDWLRNNLKLADLQSEHDRQKNRLDYTLQVIADRADRFRELERQIQVQGEAIRIKDGELTNYEQVRLGMAAALDESTKAVAQAYQQLARLQTDLDNLNAVVAQKDQTIANLNTYIEGIRNSRSWKLLQAVQKIRRLGS